MGRWQGFEEMSGLGYKHEWWVPRRDSPAVQGRLVLRPGSFRLLAPDTNYCQKQKKLQKTKTCASLRAPPPLFCPQVHKKSDVDGYRQANSGVPVTPSKLGGKVWGPDTPIGVLE